MQTLTGQGTHGKSSEEKRLPSQGTQRTGEKKRRTVEIENNNQQRRRPKRGQKAPTRVKKRKGAKGGVSHETRARIKR